jgi:hypothetical protein
MDSNFSFLIDLFIFVFSEPMVTASHPSRYTSAFSEAHTFSIGLACGRLGEDIFGLKQLCGSLRVMSTCPIEPKEEIFILVEFLDEWQYTSRDAMFSVNLTVHGIPRWQEVRLADRSS